ncbi:glycosyltransferase [Hydrocarboniclastica marina]|uniref:Glycosyltransferase n=1 Tax=Hydrocarboniclastica marina TaxID=2259620 RepID=A0A4P7XGZ8_9ALTE|nr:glycosyltransferase [Hydrocarboniclastica marina]
MRGSQPLLGLLDRSKPVKIDIVMPVLNEAEVITQSLERLQSLRVRGHRVILVDGGSRDATLANSAGLVDEVRVSAAGRALQMNEGARAQSGDVLLFLHADTRLPADAEAALEAFYGSARDWGRFDVRLSGRRPELRMIERMMSWRSRLTGIATGDQAMFVRRQTLVSVGGFPEIPLMEDVELSKRLRQRSRPYCVSSPVITSSRRWEQHGVWRTVILMWRLRFDYWRGTPPEELTKRYYRSD